MLRSSSELPQSSDVKVHKIKLKVVFIKREFLKGKSETLKNIRQRKQIKLKATSLNILVR